MRILLSIVSFSMPMFALAHGDDAPATLSFWEQFFDADYGRLVLFAGSVIVLLTIVMLFKNPDTDGAKRVVFWTISLTAILSTLYLAAGTVYENVTSATGGPVHWHADFRVFKCGEELTLIDAEGLANRVGTPEVHEHGDGRVHIEGTLGELEEASLHGFFKSVGGELTDDSFILPTNTGLVSMENGEVCSDGSPGVINAFVWKTKDGRAAQEKLVDFAEYIMTPEQLVPPGDCVVFEFGAEKEKTEYLCEQYEVAEARGDIVIER